MGEMTITFLFARFLLPVLAILLSLNLQPFFATAEQPSGDFDIKDHPLYKYVYQVDENYDYNIISQEENDGVTSYILNMTSQQWMTADFSSQPIWWHWVYVHIPNELENIDSAFMYISSGNNKNTENPPGLGSNHIARTAEMARSSKMVTGVIRMTPNQPINYGDIRGDRTEDAMISWTWKQFLQNPEQDPIILARFPMTKGAVRAMDTINDLAKRERPEISDLSRFMVAGESKRGWTTWTTGAVDERVVAIAPVVLSCLNIRESLREHYQSLGGWTFAFGDYWLDGVPQYLNHPNLTFLTDMVDPYALREALTMPKLVVKGSSDEFFPLDDTRNWWDEMYGENFLWLLDNSGHSIAGDKRDDYWAMLETFYLSVLNSEQIPKMSWQHTVNSTHGSIVMTADTEMPLTVVAFSSPSVSTRRRDFRAAALSIPPDTNITWISSSIDVVDEGVYRATFEVPSEGWFAFFIKATFTAPAGRTYHFTTEALVIPDTLPFPNCNDTCQGILV